MDLHHQGLDQHVCYQAPYVIPPDDKDAEVPIALSDEREKIDEDNLINLEEMTAEKTPEPKHGIESDQELLESEHPQAELLRWHYKLGNLPFIKINILDLLGIIPKSIDNVNPPK